MKKYILIILLFLSQFCNAQNTAQKWEAFKTNIINPAQYASSTFAWYDAKDLSTITKDGSNYVSVWYDKSKGMVLGSELVTNGELTNLTGWQNSGYNTFEILNNSLHCIKSTTGSSQVAGTLKNISLKAGCVYKLVFDFNLITGSSPIFSIANSLNGSVRNDFSALTSGNKNIIFIATTTENVIFQFWSSSSTTNEFTIDNVSIKEITGNHLTQSTASAQPQWQSDISIKYDNSNDNNSTPAVTFNQPCYLFTVLKANTWTDGDVLFDGKSATVKLYQSGSTPNIKLNAGSDLDIGALTLGKYALITIYLNGASSWVQINKGTRIYGNPGANNPGGLTFGSAYGNTNYSDLQLKESDVITSALTPYEVDGLQNYFMTANGVQP